MAKLQLTICPLTGFTVTVNNMFVVPLLPSRTEASLIESVGKGSSSTMVPVPWTFPSVTLVGLLNATPKNSVASLRLSPMTVTTTVLVVWPGANTSVPLVAT